MASMSGVKCGGRLTVSTFGYRPTLTCTVHYGFVNMCVPTCAPLTVTHSQIAASQKDESNIISYVVGDSESFFTQ